MARHSKKNLRRSGRVVRQRQRHPYLSKSRNANLSKTWTGKNTTQGNYQSLGLVHDPNTVPMTLTNVEILAETVDAAGIGGKKSIELRSTSVDGDTLQIGLKGGLSVEETTAEPKPKGKYIDEWKDHDSDRALTGHRLTAERRPPFWMSDEEVRYLKPLVNKYGEDYTAMFADIKLNCLQHTKAWLKKKCKRYNNFMATQRKSSKDA